MRTCVLALAALAFTQPAFAHGHSHKPSHHAAHHDHRHAHHAARARPRHVLAPVSAMPQAFARTDTSDTPFLSGLSFSNRPWPQHGALDAMIARHAAANGLPASLVRRVVTRESGYNPRARNGGALGLMQIKYATARGVGYGGSPRGLLDPETNLTYAVRYLAGAWRAAGGNASRAVAYYASGYRGSRHVPRGRAA